MLNKFTRLSIFPEILWVSADCDVPRAAIEACKLIVDALILLLIAVKEAWTL